MRTGSSEKVACDVAGGTLVVQQTVVSALECVTATHDCWSAVTETGHLLGLAAGLLDAAPRGRQTHTIIRLSLHQTNVQQSNVLLLYKNNSMHSHFCTLQNYTPVSLCCLKYSLFQKIYSLYIHLGICFACQGKFELRKIIDYLRGYSPFGQTIILLCSHKSSNYYIIKMFSKQVI